MFPAEVFARFQKQAIAQLSASFYLLSVEIALVEQKFPFSEAHDELKEVIGEDYRDPHHYFMSRVFISYVASFEIFLQELATSVVEQHPMKLGSVQFRLSEVLEANSSDVLVSRAIEQTLNSLMYKKPAEYRAALGDLLSVDMKPFEKHWMVFVEAKARRDLGVHANWRCNETYLRKLGEAGIPTDFKIGDLTVPDTEKYFQEVSDGMLELAEFLTANVLEKHHGLSKDQHQLRTHPGAA